MVEALMDAGYERNQDQMKWFQLRRVVEVPGHGPVAVLVDLLMPREAKFKRNKPRLLADFAVQKADGAAVAMRSFVPHTIDGTMPDGRRNSVTLRVASIPALLAMKGYALVGRKKQKDAYDIYFSVRGYDAGIDALAAECASLLGDAVALNGFRHIAIKFRSEDDFGPTTVRDFLAASEPFAGMTPEQLRLDAYRQVRAWLDRLGL